MPSDPIRIRITVRESGRTPGNPREDFWTSVTGSESNEAIASREAKLCREFGTIFRDILLKELGNPFRTINNELDSVERGMFRFMDPPFPMKEGDNSQFSEIFSRVLEHRQQRVRESPTLQSAQERLAAAAGITFSTRITGYSSLDLALMVGPFNLLARAFENDVDGFRVFLEAFIPPAFGEALSEYTLENCHFKIDIPESVETAFHASSIDARSTRVAPPASQPGGGSQARERAEWIWQVANGSLLLPVLLALVVLAYGLQILNDMRSTQYDVLTPILDHQLKLLEEDRLRLLQDATPPPPAVGPEPES